MGDSGSAHEVSTFPSREDDLHTRGILPATWSASIHSIEQRLEVYDALLKDPPKGYGDTVDHEYSLPPSDRWSVGEDHTDFRGHAAIMCPRS